MESRVIPIELEEAYGMIPDYKYALVYMMSHVHFCKIENLPPIDWSECLEARFFSKEGEVHIYEEDGALKAVKIIADEQVERIVKKYEINQGRFKGIGKYLCVEEYLDYDEDGQAVVVLTRLRDVE